MDIQVKREQSVTRVELSGSIDIEGSEALKKSLGQLIGEGAREVEIDFKGVSFIGSSGIGKLLLFYKNYTAQGGKIRIVHLNNDLLALFKAIRLDRLFNIQ
jgi:anti-sigma B factor antagonist